MCDAVGRQLARPEPSEVCGVLTYKRGRSTRTARISAWVVGVILAAWVAAMVWL